MRALLVCAGAHLLCACARLVCAGARLICACARLVCAGARSFLAMVAYFIFMRFTLKNLFRQLENLREAEQGASMKNIAPELEPKWNIIKSMRLRIMSVYIGDTDLDGGALARPCCSKHEHNVMGSGSVFRSSFPG